jgi:hypothetical protein
MDTSGMDMDIDIDNPGMDMDMDMYLDMDMDSKAVSHSINKGLQPKAADCSLHHVQSAETRHALGSHDDQDHRILAHHDQDRHVQGHHDQDRHVRGHHGLDRLRAHLVVAVILALQVSSFSGSLTFLYS